MNLEAVDTWMWILYYIMLSILLVVIIAAFIIITKRKQKQEETVIIPHKASKLAQQRTPDFNYSLEDPNLKADGTRNKVRYSLHKVGDSGEYETDVLKVEQGATLKIADGFHCYYYDCLPFIATGEFGDVVFVHSGSFKVFLNYQKKEISIKYIKGESSTMDKENNQENSGISNNLIEIEPPEGPELNW